LEWFDSFFIENERKKLEIALSDYLKKSKEKKATEEDARKLKELFYENKSEIAKMKKPLFKKYLS